MKKTDKLDRCKYCRKPGQIVEFDGMFYAVCTTCKRWNTYEFLGLSSSVATKLWNEANCVIPKKYRKKEI